MEWSLDIGHVWHVIGMEPQVSSSICCVVAEARQEELHRSKSEAADMMKMSPLDWFGKWQESTAVPGSEAYPAKLGKVGWGTQSLGGPVQRTCTCCVWIQSAAVLMP